MKSLILSVLISGFFSSCSFVRNEQVFGRYHILAIDVPDKLCLAYELENEDYICIVPSKVLAYSKNEQFIFIKQVPYENKDILDVNYYIIPILKDNPPVFPENRIIGPLTEQKFKEEISKMKFKNLKFKNLN